MSTFTPGLAFRPDIEALRALAVLLVVGSHAGVPGLAGGYVGVDVFFVISGFLITLLLRREWRARGNIDVPDFYARRLRRLLPAFTLMLAVVVAAIFLVYSPLEQPRLLGSAFAAALYASNLRFAADATDYLAPSAKLDPLLHTWSLGVEEQFYLAWPLLLLVACRAGQPGRQALRPMTVLLCGVVLLSLAATVMLTPVRQPWAFFLPFTRAWEFGLGALVAIAGERAGTRQRMKGAAVAGLTAGLGLVLGSAWLLDEHSLFPGWAALAPAAGTALMLHATPALASPPALARLPGAAPLQWLGRLSYGWYLWHWPVLVIARAVWPGLALPACLALMLFALFLSWVSHVLVEQPLRYGSRFRSWRLAAGTAVGVIAAQVLVIQALGSQAQAALLSPRFEHITAASTDFPYIYGHGCDGGTLSATVTACTGADPQGSRTAVLIGDSMAAQWFPALEAVLRPGRWRLVMFSKSSCPAVASDYFHAALGRSYTECHQWRDALLARTLALQPELVILASGEHYPFSATDWQSGIAGFLFPLAEAVPRVVILRAALLPGFDVPQCLARRAWQPGLFTRTCRFDPATARPMAASDAYRVVEAAHANVRLLDLAPSICPVSPCPVTQGALIKFRDDKHLTDHFVRTLVPTLRAGLQADGQVPP